MYTTRAALFVGAHRLMKSHVMKRKEFGLRLALRLVEKAPQALGLNELDEPDTDAGASSNDARATRASRMGTEAIDAIRGVEEKHDVFKLGERLVKAIEKPGGVVAQAHAQQFEQDMENNFGD